MNLDLCHKSANQDIKKNIHVGRKYIAMKQQIKILRKIFM